MVTIMALPAKYYPHCYTLLRRRGHTAWKAAEIVLEARRGGKFAIDWVKCMRRLEVREREQADYDLYRRAT